MKGAEALGSQGQHLPGQRLLLFLHLKILTEMLVVTGLACGAFGDRRDPWLLPLGWSKRGSLWP